MDKWDIQGQSVEKTKMQREKIEAMYAQIWSI